MKNDNEMLFKEHKFEALVEKVRLQTEFIDAGKKKSDRVAVTVPAVLFEPPVFIENAAKPGRSYGEEIDFYLHYIKANMEGTQEDILSCWEESERESKKEMMDNPELFKRNRDYFLKNPDVTFMGVVKQKDTVSLLVGDSMVMGVPLRKINGKYQLSKTPNDSELAIIEASYW